MAAPPSWKILPPVCQQLAQAPPRMKHPRLHRVDRTAHDLGDLAIAHLMEIGELDHRPVVVGKVTSSSGGTDVVNYTVTAPTFTSTQAAALTRNERERALFQARAAGCASQLPRAQVTKWDSYPHGITTEMSRPPGSGCAT